MKKPTLIIAMCIMVLYGFAQDTTRHYRNEFGLDATGFLKQFLNFDNNQQLTTTYTPTYYLTYRRHFSGVNLRIAVGGSFMNNQLAPPYPSDSTKYFDQGYSLYASIGFEFYSNLTKKWQVYYGLDFRTSIIYSKDDYQFQNNFYVQGEEAKSEIFGIAPFLGIRFKLTKRLSILTEASYSVNWEQDNSGNFYTALAGATPPAPPNTNQKLIKMYSSFYQPLSVFIDFRL